MEYALPASWGSDNRGFWTKRKKSATSMLAILALIAGVALAFKLFDQTVPNNVVRDASNFNFAVSVFRAPIGGGATTWLPAGSVNPIFPPGVDVFPGDTTSQKVRIQNTNTAPARDATFFMYVDPASIVVRRCTVDAANPNTCLAGSDLVIGPLDPNRAKFIHFFSLSIDKEKVLTALGAADVNENDHAILPPPPAPADHDAAGNNQTSEACSGGLLEITKTAPCNLGTARAAGSTEPTVVNGPLQPTDTRWYTFKLSEADDGTDQSGFEGWTVTFSMVFQARVPAIPDSGTVVTER